MKVSCLKVSGKAIVNKSISKICTDTVHTSKSVLSEKRKSKLIVYIHRLLAQLIYKRNYGVLEANAEDSNRPFTCKDCI